MKKSKSNVMITVHPNNRNNVTNVEINYQLNTHRNINRYVKQ
jgi:hypothetical protein